MRRSPSPAPAGSSLLRRFPLLGGARGAPGPAAGALLALGTFLLFPPPASAAEIYRWTDESGQVHFTEDITRVPREQRPAARSAARRAEEEGDRGQHVNVYDASEAHPAPPAAREAGRAERGERRVHRVEVERAGTALLVAARVNDRVVVPFLVDTGASDVLLPRWAAERLGLSDAGRTREYLTANGVVEEPVAMLSSVELGGARVEEVPASISSSMQVGLLGLSFFNHFTYHVDAAEGILTLVPNDLAERGAIRGGRSPAQWRAEFAGLRRRLERLEAERRAAGSTASSRHERLDEGRRELLRQMELLEAEADRARVPLDWRE